MIKKNGSLQLKDKNFRVNSEGWTSLVANQGIVCLQNPEGDVWEFVEGVSEELVGEQLFASSARMRETKKAGELMPTDEEWSILLRSREDICNLVFAGFRFSNGAFRCLNDQAFFGSSSVSDIGVWGRNLYSDTLVVTRFKSITGGVSIRCLDM
ncbi:MAG: hypothetical protein KAS02_01035 [Candidatus Pacebacteria bacterium]|nr:hypothetical protein [Candidatus Paceibacterota bacterium]